ncbi:MAG: formylglycine-generating enzyme family protein [Deltaproteobacteria bacterium]|nr:formylglycine-generating enzyme family protein [Deltaproteobacteria bacterium]
MWLVLPAAVGCGCGDDDDDDDAGGDDDTGDDDTAGDDDAVDDDADDDTAGDDDDVDDDTGDDDTADDDTADDDDDDTGPPPQCPDVEPLVFEPAMELVSSGTFLMGSPESEQYVYPDFGGPGDPAWEVQHQVTLTRDFYVAKHEVTQSLWLGLMGEFPPGQWDCDNDFPIGTVSWNRAVDFCNALSEQYGYDTCYTRDGEGVVTWDWECDGFRLPTEAEWEYAARGGTTTAYYGGDVTDWNCAEDNLTDIAWYCGTSEFDINKVGTKDANAYGLHDMLGSVWEWTWDGIDDETDVPYQFDEEPVLDPTGPGGTVAHMYRGGSMFASAADCRAAYRRVGVADRLDEDNGLRVVRTSFDE